MLEATWQDLRYGLRLLAKNPGFTSVAVLSLALGIGANTAIFTLINAVMLKMLPVSHPEQLVSLWLTQPNDQNFSRSVDGNSETAFPYPTFLQMGARNQVFSHLYRAQSSGPAERTSRRRGGTGPRANGFNELFHGPRRSDRAGTRLQR